MVNFFKSLSQSLECLKGVIFMALINDTQAETHGHEESFRQLIKRMRSFTGRSRCQSKTRTPPW